MSYSLPVDEWRVLWFSPNAGLWESSQLEHELANGLVLRGAEVTVIRCRGLFDSFCPTMQAFGLSQQSTNRDKRNACKTCKGDQATFQDLASYTTIWLDDFITSIQRGIVHEKIKDISPENWTDVFANEIPIGKYATYLSMLHHKVPNVASSQRAWDEYISDLTNALYAAEALPSIFDQFNPTHCFVYNPLYPTNRVFTEIALQNPDIQYVGLSAGGYVPNRYSCLAIYRSIQSSQTAVDSSTLMQSLKIPLSRLEIEFTARHIGQLVQGKDPWVYSSPPTNLSKGEIRDQLGIPTKGSVAVVLVGSPDETRSSALVDAEYERVPIEHISSVQEFIEEALKVARELPEINFVFRLHPRLAPNKRESLRSPDLDAIEELLQRRSANVVINSPDDGIGLYDVARIANIGINHASSAGLEFLALGIPVIHYDPPRLNAYPPQLGLLVGRGDTEGFLRSVNSLTEPGKTTLDSPDIDIALAAWRWYSVTLLRALAHKSWEIKKLHQVQQEQNPPRMQNLRKLLPEGLREKASRYLSQRQRRRVIEDKGSKDSISTWIDECIERISCFDNSTVWNPIAITRGTSLTADEEIKLVQLEIGKIRELISS